jgi:hypothetical protein
LNKEENEMGKNAKYVIDKVKANAKALPFETKTDPSIIKPIVTVDKETVPNSEFLAEAKWILPGTKTEIKLCESHTHQYGEMLGFYGFNYDNIQDLGAEIEIIIDNEKNVVDRSFAAYVPPGIQHGPIIVRNVKRPIFWISSARTPKAE